MVEPEVSAELAARLTVKSAAAEAEEWVAEKLVLVVDCRPKLMDWVECCP